MTMKNTFREHLQRAILETCDIWDTDYNSENWEPEFMTIFVTWQLRHDLTKKRDNDKDKYKDKGNDRDKFI